MRSSAMPCGDRLREAVVEKRRDLVDDVLVPRRVLHRRRVALHVHEADVDARVRDDRRELRVAAERRHVVHHRRSECDRPARHLGAGGVDRDPARPTRSSSTGTTRRSSSASLTGSAPGRVDSPPTSTSDAPSASIRRAASAAASGEAYDPPSEKLSGVTLTIPITAGRGQRSSFAGRLIVHGR